MHPIKIGDVTVSRHVEQGNIPVRTAGAMFPEAMPREIRCALAELPEFTFDAADDDKLVINYQSFVLRTPTATVLIDACLGEHSYLTMPFSRQPYLDSFAQIGVSFEDIDFVFCTHMHVDHVGWHTRLLDGRLVPSFPNARYIFCRREYEVARAARSPYARALFDECIRPIVDAGQAMLVEDNFVLNDALRLVPAPGHSPGHVCVKLVSNGQHALFSGDLMHHAIQALEPSWYTIFCSDPIQCVATRRTLLKAYANTETLIFPAHFNGPTAGLIEPFKNNRWRYRFVEP